MMSSGDRNTSLTGKFKKAFNLGGTHKRDGVADAQPLASGAHGQATTPATTTQERMPAATHDTMTTPANDVRADGHRSVGTALKESFASAPWESHHDKTLEALTHAKAAHIKATQAQAHLKAAAESKHKAELAQRHLDELERELEAHRQGNDGLANKKKDWENAKLAHAEHLKNHDHHSRLAREAEDAAAAKEAEAARLAPLHEEHAKGLAPLHEEHTTAQKARADAEAKREDLLRQLRELEANLGPMRTREADAAKKLEEHNALGDGHKQRAAAAAEEAQLLRQKANDHRNGLEPHARKLKDAQGLLAVKENEYNKAQQAAEAAGQRLPQLKQQHEAAQREAKEAALAAQKHADAFDKFKKEAEVEDAKKTDLWNQARQTAHIEDDGSSKQELHKLADRFHTVLKSPIDTTSLAGQNVTSDIRQTAAKISGTGGTEAGDGVGTGAANGERGLGAADGAPGAGGHGSHALRGADDRAMTPKTPDNGSTQRMGADTNGTGLGAAPDTATRPKKANVTTPAYTPTAVHEE